MNLNFDASGRLWVTGTELYPWPAAVDAEGREIPEFAQVYEEIANAFGSAGHAPPVETVGKDTIRVLGNFAENGRAREIRVFADGLNIPTGILPLPREPGARGDSVIAYSIPDIRRFDDTDGDGKADRSEILYTGFGFLDTHGMSSNYVQWIDGWIYGCHGFRNQSDIRDRGGNVLPMNSGNTYRFRPDGSRIEYWSHGQTNPFGLAFDPRGNVYSADSHSKPVYLLQRGGYYEGIGKDHDGLGHGPRVTDDDHGSSAIAGVMFYRDDRWPEEYHGNVFNGNPVTRRVNRATLEWHGSSPKATRVEDFVSCDDPWFRPVQTKLGPDGALYIADFYNPIIGHYEEPLNHPDRDRLHGRIWRVVWKGGGEAAPLRDLTGLDDDGLIVELGNANSEIRWLAGNEIHARLASGGAAENSLALALEEGCSEQRVNALWILARWKPGILSGEKVVKIWGGGDSLLRLHLVRLLATLEVEREALAALLRLAAGDLGEDRHVHRALLDFAAAHPSGEGLKLVDGISDVEAEGDVQLAYAVKIALREILRQPEGYEWAKEIPLDSPLGWRIAEASLAVYRPEAAELLLNRLVSENFSGPRAGDLIRHVATHIPTEKFSEIVEIANRDEVPREQQLAIADALGTAARNRAVTWSGDAEGWVHRIAIETLASRNEQQVRRAVDALRGSEMEAKLQPLSVIAREDGRPKDLRIAALEACSNLPEAGDVMLAVLADRNSSLRKRAAELLGRQTVNAAVAHAMAECLPDAPRELAVAIAGVLAGSETGAEILLSVIGEGKSPASLLRHQSVAGPLAGREGMRERVEELTKDLPPEDARLDQVIAGRLKEIGTLEGDGARGEEIFGQQCAVCHKVKNEGGNIGPNLDGVGARGIHRLVEDILDPNRNVDPAFRPVVIETRDGRVVSGVNLREQGGLLVLNNAEGQEISIREDEVKSRVNSSLSLMPAVYEQVLSAKDLADLLGFLVGRE